VPGIDTSTAEFASGSKQNKSGLIISIDGCVQVIIGAAARGCFSVDRLSGQFHQVWVPS